MEKFRFSPTLHKSTLRKAPAKAPALSDIIPGRPDGESTFYERASVGYLVFFGNVFAMEDSGAVCEIVKGDDGKTYLNVPISGTYLDNWAECTLTDTELVIPGNQPLMYEEEYGDFLTLTVLDFVEDEDGGWYYPADDQNFRMEVKDGVISSEPGNGETILGLCYYTPEDDYYEWAGFGDWNYVITPFTGVAEAGPADAAATENWALLDDNDGYFVGVNATEDSLYLRGLYPTLPDAWIKAPMTDGKAEITEPVYVGMDTGHYIYFQPAANESVWDEWYEDYVDEILPSSAPFVFVYDGEARKITSEGILAATHGVPSEDLWYAYATLENITVVKQDRKAGIPPVAPSDLTDVPDPDYPEFTFVLPPFDVEGNLLDTSRLYYNVFVDGEIFVFYPDEYMELTEEMTDIPYSFTENWDIVVDGTLREIYYYWNGVDTIGVRAFYLEEDGSKTYGEMTVLNLDENGVKATAAEALTTQYYDLHGIRVAAPGKGVFVSRSVMSDGSVKVSKTVR